MKSFILLVLTFGSITAHAYREVVGGGGGTLDSNGRYTTFFSANIPVRQEALRPQEIGGMDLLVQRLASLEISGKNKSLILRQIFPSGRRNYFKVDEAQLSRELKEKIVSQYAKLMKVPPEKVVIYGLTDPQTKDTFLMPAFFGLTPTQQAAILFHESLWILNPELQYDQVITAEQAIQAFFEQPGNDEYLYNFYYQLGKLVADAKLPIFPILKRESLKGFIWAKEQGRPTNDIYLTDLFGESFLRCADAASISKTMGAEVECSSQLLTELVLKSQQYPDSISLRYLVDFLVGNGVVSLQVPLNSMYPRIGSFYELLKISLSDFDIEGSDKTPVSVKSEKAGIFGFLWKSRTWGESTPAS